MIPDYNQRRQQQTKNRIQNEHESHTVGVPPLYGMLCSHRAANFYWKMPIVWFVFAFCYDGFVTRLISSCVAVARARSHQHKLIWINSKCFSLLSIGWLDLDHIIGMSVVFFGFVVRHPKSFVCFVSVNSELWCVPRRHLIDTTLNINSNDLRSRARGLSICHTHTRILTKYLRLKLICIAHNAQTPHRLDNHSECVHLRQPKNANKVTKLFCGRCVSWMGTWFNEKKKTKRSTFCGVANGYRIVGEWVICESCARAAGRRVTFT